MGVSRENVCFRSFFKISPGTGQCDILANLALPLEMYVNDEHVPKKNSKLLLTIMSHACANEVLDSNSWEFLIDAYIFLFWYYIPT